VNYSPITLYISLGKEKTDMLNLIGMSSSRAKLALEQKGIKFEVKEEHNERVPAGEVYDQVPHPEAKIIADETNAVIYVSKGLKSFPMPNLVTKSLNEAEMIIQEQQLIRGTIHQEPSYIIPQGEVIRQSPFKENDEVSRGEIIDLWVSSGFPANARFYEEAINVQPTSSGEKTDVVIRVNDARGKDQIFYQRTIADEELFNVQIVLAPNTIGVIEVYLNGVFVDSRAVSY
jgi:serine/threonine-protein kinase